MGGFLMAVGVVYAMAILVQIACYRSSLKKGTRENGVGVVAAQGCH
ncbi:hypothetical protein KP003_18200 [Geomonas nitrogeniifigens]|uniref:Uncharacterized protein n=1 Tax=Geomonas diazotrophica TaxID=2843197 RepID=A0ABX8JHV7_9BACT|nr:hypothetical protein [Geomonas nitrogeniifigens]QWV97097.1 hypothetical protein KP005_17385 [Geomonas nitrogeniifigens]QXE86269.1 hypothetical protein KP003_18200 [Geomonas nitrogeniifigens]